MDNKPLKLMCILAHPDDESLATGGILAKYAAAGVQTYLIMATRGERGWTGPAAKYPGPQALGRLREAELRAAAHTLGLHEVIFLDYQDGELDQADSTEAIGKIVTQLRRLRPEVVVTLDPQGIYGHPDHIAISQLTTAAVLAAADPTYRPLSDDLPHRVAKLYYRAFTPAEQAAYEAAFGRLSMRIDGFERGFTAWPEWAITTRIDTSAYWEQVWQAIECHCSQLPGYQKLKALPDDYHAHLWGTQTFYRVISLVNGGREVEDDLFAGLREWVQPPALFYLAPSLVGELS